MDRVNSSAATLLLAILMQPADAIEPLSDDRTQSIDAFVTQYSDFAMFDGSILIDIGGSQLYEQSYGYAHVELAIRHTAETRFHLASVSKAITDAAVAKMIEQGVISLDTTVAKFLPDFPSATAITVGHLLTNTSGIPHTNRLPWGDGTQSLTIQQIIERLSDLPLDYEPGADSGYSNGDYAVLARILEIAGNGTYDEVLRATIFDPLGMHNSGHISDVRTPLPNKATGYEPGLKPGERRHTRFYAVESKPGGGSLYSTLADMHKFMRGIFRDDFIPEQLRRDVMGEDDEGYLAQGRSPGFVAKTLFRTSDDVIVVSLSNSYSVPSDWALAIADLATGAAENNPWPELVPARKPVDSSDPRLGLYRSSYGDAETTLSRGPEGELIISGSNNSRNALIPLEDGNFLQPLYFQLCVQDDDSRVFVCKMLSGEEAYTSTFTPVEDHAIGH
jgi:CubicO group peptidase (beta-lactamase class C family)